MDIITNYDQYVESMAGILASNKGKVRLSTFNMFVRGQSKTEAVLDAMPKGSKVLLGTSYSECHPGCKHCVVLNIKRSDRFEKYQDRWGLKVTNNLHMKYFSRGKAAIIGGFNVSESTYLDTAVVIDCQETIRKFNKLFDGRYESCQGDMFYKADKTDPVFMFGKYKGTPVAKVLSEDPAYIKWIIQTLEKEKLVKLGLLNE